MESGRCVAWIDETHGQANWSQTGFGPRLCTANFRGLAETMQEMGADCIRLTAKPLAPRFPDVRLAVVPPPTGTYDPEQECWRRDPGSLFTSEDLYCLLGFVRDGGSLLLFAYRFGDGFTQTNLQDLIGPLGCHLNEDAIIDLTRLRDVHPLQFCFETPPDALRMPWSMKGVQSVFWRSVATFTILPGATAHPLAYSPGGRCISFDRLRRRICFQSLPVAVAGTFGRGKFALFGGPHLFEVGPLGLLEAGQNRRFLRNTLTWLLNDQCADLHAAGPQPEDEMSALLAVANEHWRELCQIEGTGDGSQVVAFVERVLRETGVMKALARPTWMP